MIAGLFAGLFIASTLNSEAQFVEPKEYQPDSPIGLVSNTTTQFIDSVSPKEKFNNANNVSDLLNK